MEQLLNIVWVLVVAGIALAAAIDSRTRGRRGFVFFVVFACIGLLLFPVISASDDLHPACDFSDDAAWRHDKRSLGMQVLALPILISVGLSLASGSRPLRGSIVPTLVRTSRGYLRLAIERGPPLGF